jgi:hypothetical protein
MSGADLGQFAIGFREFRKMLAAVPQTSKVQIFINAASEAAGYCSKGLDRTVAADELLDIATSNGLDDVDAVQWIIARAFERIEERDHVPDDIGGILDEEPRQPQPDTGSNGRHDRRKSRLQILSKPEFINGFVPPDYLIDGMLQRRFVYSLTGSTGHAKSAIALAISELVARADPSTRYFGPHEVASGRVCYFVGENPDDIRMRVIGADSKRNSGDDPLADRIHFICGVFNISEMFNQLVTCITEFGGIELIVVDTSAAYFLGNEELSNTQMGAHARMLRRLTGLPGGPCVLVLCHPIKHANEPSQLLPRGGGAFLAEMDGNLTAWKHDDMLIDLHHHGKFRGPGFEPISLKLDRIITKKLTDARGRQIPTVRAIVINQIEEDQQTNKAKDDEDLLLTKLLANSTASTADLAQACGWVSQAGPQKAKVHRLLVRLSQVRPSLVKNPRGHQWQLTEEGKKTAREVTLRLMQRDLQNDPQIGMQL